MEDVGVKVATSVYEFFNNKDNLQVLQQLEQSGINLTNQKKQTVTASNFSGLNFLFTGTLTQLKRTEAEEMVEQKGGSILSSVSSKLNYLVVGEDAGSKLEKAKKIQTIRIIDEQEFIDLINGKEDFD